MGRFLLALSAVALTLVLAPLIQAEPKGTVFFLEGGNEGYLRSSDSGNVEGDAFSGENTAAAVAVLLGVPPPVLMSPASSDKLASLLSPNPFKRPHTVLFLSIGGVVLESLKMQEIEEILGVSSFQQRPFSLDAHQKPFELSGQDVTLQLLNSGNFEEYNLGPSDILQLEQGLRALVSFLKGSYNKEEASDVASLKIQLPLGDDISISIDLYKNADRKFAVELYSLFQLTESLPRLQKELQQGSQNLAKLFMGTFTGLELMDKESIHRQHSTKLFLYAAAQVLGALEATYNGQIVGVFAMPSITTTTTTLPLLDVIKDSGSSRFLLDDLMAPSPSEAYPNETLYQAASAKLISRSIVIFTVLILLVATGLGSCFLVYMPLTRDTLLYSGVKVD